MSDVSWLPQVWHHRCLISTATNLFIISSPEWRRLGRLWLAVCFSSSASRCSCPASSSQLRLVGGSTWTEGPQLVAPSSPRTRPWPGRITPPLSARSRLAPPLQVDRETGGGETEHAPVSLQLASLTVQTLPLILFILILALLLLLDALDLPPVRFHGNASGGSGHCVGGWRWGGGGGGERGWWWRRQHPVETDQTANQSMRQIKLSLSANQSQILEQRLVVVGLLMLLFPGSRKSLTGPRSVRPSSSWPLWHYGFMTWHQI